MTISTCAGSEPEMRREQSLALTENHIPDGNRTPSPSLNSTNPWDPRLAALAFLTCGAMLLLNAYPVIRPSLRGDDFEILVRAWTWDRTLHALWEPQNEHTMPLGRLTTWGLAKLAGRPTMLPQVAALQGPLSLLAILGSLYVFVSRELGNGIYGVAAMALFGVSSVYAEAVWWFSAGFSLLALATLLLALLAAQRWRQTGRIGWLVLCAAGVALAPCWFAIGILAGPLCALYLLPGDVRAGLRPAAKQTLAALVPFLGTALFLAVSLPLTIQHIWHLEHYSGKSPLESFQPSIGAWYTVRSVVDSLALGVVGVSEVTCPVWLLPFGWVLLLVAGVWWWRRAPGRRLLVLGLAFVFTSYLLIYSARADWGYAQVSSWGRYQLFAQLGLGLFVCGGLPSLRFFQVEGRLSRTQFTRLAMALAILFLIQLPRSLIQQIYQSQGASEQQAFLRRIEEKDAQCRQHRIDAETARAALEPLKIPDNEKENGWDFLRGSDDPRPITIKEARHLLKENE
jgi:hypothetical protein